MAKDLPLNKKKQYPLRGQTSKDPSYITPTKPTTSKGCKAPSNPSTPSSKICSICNGFDEMRNIKLKEVVEEFTACIDDYKLLKKSLQENASTLNQAVDTIKHFIQMFEPSKAVNSMDKLNYDISLLADNVSDVSNYITKLDKLDKIEEFVVERTHCNSHKTDSSSEKFINDRLNNLESLCKQLNCKIDTLNSTSTVNHSITIPNNITNHDLVNNGNSSITNHGAPKDPNTCIILGDSNTKYIDLNHRFHKSIRVPTYTISDIDPNKCIGYSKIWLHVGINSLKSHNCSSNRDVHFHFDHFLNKIKTIRSLCPRSRIIISPILPTNIQALNERALLFNRLLFSTRENVTFLNFNMFCDNNGRLSKIYRCYNNEHDNIHLGSLGIQILKSKLIFALSHIDKRSYGTVLRNNLL